VDKYVTYFEAQIKEAYNRPDSPYITGFINGLQVAIRAIKDGEVGIFSTGSDDFYEG
jgi:hypothetical protein